MGGHRVYIGHLSRNAEKRDLEDLFKSYGRILDITVKNGFGFVEFDDKADAEDAVHDFHGTKFMGQRLIVELAMSRRREPRHEHKETNRIVVKNIPSKTTWQDLKDFMRKAGRVTFADILKDRDGEGVVEFARRDDMKYALKNLDNEKLNGQRVTLDEAGRRRRSRDRSRSPRRSSRRRSRSVSRSRSRSRSRSARSLTPRSRSRSPRSRSRSRSRSAHSRSRSRSPPRDGDDIVMDDKPAEVKEEEEEVVDTKTEQRSPSVQSRTSQDSRE